MTAEHEIRSLLTTYERSLNQSDVDMAVSCYAADGVFMGVGLPTVSGAGLKQAYAQIFDTIRLEVSFTVDELVVVTQQVAYALTRSGGTQTVLADGTATAESNREVFLFAHEDGQWKISRYLFNKPG